MHFMTAFALVVAVALTPVFLRALLERFRGGGYMRRFLLGICLSLIVVRVYRSRF